MSDEKRILIVDDSYLVRAVLTGAVAAEGHAVIAASSVAEAMAHEGPFDAAIVDIELPDGNGVDFARASLLAGKVARVIFNSDTIDPSLRAAAAALGPVVSKDLDDLLRQLRAVLATL